MAGIDVAEPSKNASKFVKLVTVTLRPAVRIVWAVRSSTDDPAGRVDFAFSRPEASTKI